MDEALRILVAQHHPTSSGNVWFAELRSLGALAIPVMVQTGAQQGMAVTDQVFLGHLGTAEMAAAALANAFTNLMWFFLLGFATALDTLGSHAYGAGDHGALVVSCAAAAVLCSLLVAPLAGGMALGEAAGRVLFGQDQHTAALMGRFCNGLIPGMWPLMWGTVMAKYLQVQNNMLSPSLIAVATFLLNIAFNAALVHRLGFRGAPLATSLSRWAQCGMLAAAVALHERARTRRVRGKPRRQRLPQPVVPVPYDTEALLSPSWASTPRANVGVGGCVLGSFGRTSLCPRVTGMSPAETEARFGPAHFVEYHGPGPSSSDGLLKGRERTLEQEVDLFAACEVAERSPTTSAHNEKTSNEDTLLCVNAKDGRNSGSNKSQGGDHEGAFPAAAARLLCQATKAPMTQGPSPSRIELCWPPADKPSCFRSDSGARGESEGTCAACGIGAGGNMATTSSHSDAASVSHGSGLTPAARVAARPDEATAPIGSEELTGERTGEPADELRGWWRGALATCREAMRPRVLGRFLRLGIPGGLSMSFEMSCFEFTTVLAGRLGPAATAAHAAMVSIVQLSYLTCPFALATAGSIRVGNLLGAGEPAGARRAGVLAVSLSGGFMALMALALLACRRVLGFVFTTDPAVVQLISELTVFTAFFQVSDGLMGSSQGVLRGCGHQHLTALFNFAGFWVCGVLLGYLLCFKAGLGLHGLWAGIASGDTATCVLNLVAMSRIRWGQEADKARARVKALAEQAEEEQAMLPGGPGSAMDAEAEPARQQETGRSSSAGSVRGSDGVVHASPALGGGGRSFAGGLKRMWSELSACKRVAEAGAPAGRSAATAAEGPLQFGCGEAAGRRPNMEGS